ncbi:MAG: (2Fe-2S)-binding protein [Pseudomonadota bacterium]
MIVCSCTGISDHEIRAVIEAMRAADQHTLITPGKVYRALGKKADCGGCIRLFVDTIWNHSNFAHIWNDSKKRSPPDLTTPTSQQKGQPHERRRKSHRVPQQSAQKRADSHQPVLVALPAAE